MAAAANTQVLLFNKPYGVLTQFQDDQARPTLKRYIPVPGVYPAGRLDLDSEGLLVLTNNGQLQARITDPQCKLPKTYWVQVEGRANELHLQQLRQGLVLKDGPTKPAEATLLEAPQLWSRDPPIRVRQSIPTSWLSLTLYEGRNRQVRRMTAAVGLPTLRLVRVQIGPWTLDTLAPGAWRLVDSVLL